MRRILEQTVLVVARKYNDIIYAVSTDEFKFAQKRVLLIISQNSLNKFPLIERFTDVIRLEIQGISLWDQFILLKKLYEIRTKFMCDTILLSNIVLFSHQFIVKQSRCRNILLLEDGYMNYRSDRFDNNYKKDLFIRIFGIKNPKHIISGTYLLKPDSAKYYFGQKKRLIIDSDCISNCNPPNLNGKRIFVGQPLYITTKCSIELYSRAVNFFLKEFKIDYYLPHFFSSLEENINCNILDLNKYATTLEALASRYDFSLISFSSSLLFTTRMINPKVESTMVNFPGIPTIVDSDIFVNCGVNCYNYY